MGPGMGVDESMSGEGAEEAGEPPNEPPSEEENEPPNLRDSDSMDSCGQCLNFSLGEAGGGTCAKYGDTPVTPYQVCDGFESADEEAGEADQGPEEEMAEGENPARIAAVRGPRGAAVGVRRPY